MSARQIATRSGHTVALLERLADPFAAVFGASRSNRSGTDAARVRAERERERRAAQLYGTPLERLSCAHPGVEDYYAAQSDFIAAVRRRADRRVKHLREYEQRVLDEFAAHAAHYALCVQADRVMELCGRIGLPVPERDALHDALAASLRPELDGEFYPPASHPGAGHYLTCRRAAELSAHAILDGVAARDGRPLERERRRRATLLLAGAIGQSDALAEDTLALLDTLA